jgi:hypothetical protein
MEKEGRLFRDGVIAKADDDRTDTAASGLNFITHRPRTEVLRDLADVLDQLYEPKNHYARLALTLRQLKIAHKFRPPVRKLLRMSRGLKGIMKLVGMDRQTAPYFWKTLALTLATNPGALEFLIGSAVMNANYGNQSKSYVKALREQIAHVQKVGEKEYNRSMGARVAQVSATA